MLPRSDALPVLSACHPTSPGTWATNGQARGLGRTAVDPQVSARWQQSPGCLRSDTRSRRNTDPRPHRWPLHRGLRATRSDSELGRCRPTTPFAGSQPCAQHRPDPEPGCEKLMAARTWVHRPTQIATPSPHTALPRPVPGSRAGPSWKGPVCSACDRPVHQAQP